MARRRGSAQNDEAMGFFILLIGSSLYTFVTTLTVPARIALGVATASVLGLLSSRIIRRMRHAQRQRLLLADVRDLRPIDFERRIVHLLHDLGWERVEHVGGSGDGGIDIRGIYRGERSVVQCKRYRGRVGPNHLRELWGAIRGTDIDRAYLITTGHFTMQGRAFVRDKPIELWDGAVLADRIIEHQRHINDPERQRRSQARLRWALLCLIVLNAVVMGWAWGTSVPAVSVAMQSSAPSDPRDTALASVQPHTSTPDVCGTAKIDGVERLVMRAAPGLSTARLSDYPAGTTVTLLCTAPITADDLVWQHVRIDRFDGWMSKRFLQ